MTTSRFMQLALESAKSARGRALSNPWVGAVVVRDGEAIARGATLPHSGGHAEAAALGNVDARGAELYVTLEPCVAFEGKRTLPCAQTVIDSEVGRVIVAMLDPDPRVAGRGVALLRKAGIAVEVGDGAEPAVQLLRPFLKHAQTGQPYVIVKFAASLDGRTATRSGDSKWITGAGARDHSHQQRAWVDAVMVGSGTVLADDPELTARPGGVPTDHQPVRVVLDARGRTPVGAALFNRASTLIFATTPRAPRHWKAAMVARGATLIECEASEDGVNLAQLLSILGQRKIGSIWVEGGGTLIGSMLAGDHVDEVWGYLAPVLIGGDGLAAVGGPGALTMPEAVRLSNVAVELLPPDVLIRGNAGSWTPKLVS